MIDGIKIGAALTIAFLLAAVGLLAYLWRSEVKDFAEFKAGVTAAGELAIKEKKRIEGEHDKVLKDVSVAWDKAMGDAVGGAVAAARRRFNDADRLFNYPRGCPLPGSPGDAKKDAPAIEERVAVDEGFIRDCATDAAAVDIWNAWADGNGIPVKE